MKARVLVLAAVAASVLAAVPRAAHADLPVKVLDPPGEHYIGGGDPWVPDGRDPVRILAAPEQGVVDEGIGAVDRARVLRGQLWMQRIARILRALSGGWLR